MILCQIFKKAARLRDPDVTSPVWIALLAAVLPMRLKRRIYRTVFGWQIADSARVGISVLHGEHFELKRESYVGHFNIIKEIRRFTLGESAYVKNSNHMFAQAMDVFPDRHLSIGDGTLVMSRHFFDVSGVIEIGTNCIIGGRETQLWSHSVFIRDGRRTLEPRVLRIGAGCYIGARAILVHCLIADDCTVGAGAVVTKAFEVPNVMIAGNPATSRTR